MGWPMIIRLITSDGFWGTTKPVLLEPFRILALGVLVYMCMDSSDSLPLFCLGHAGGTPYLLCSSTSILVDSSNEILTVPPVP